MSRGRQPRRGRRAPGASESGWQGPWPVIVLTALAAALRLYGLGQQSLWTDEAHTIAVAGVPRAPEVPPWRPADLLLVTQGPLFMGLVHVWSRVVGTGEAALRLLPALFSLATIPPFLALASRLLGRPAAVFATLLLAVSPFHIWYGQELRGYSLLMLAAVLATFSFVELISGRGGGRHVLFYIASFLSGLGASLAMGFLLPLHGLVVLARWRRLGRRLFAFALSWLVIALAVTPWLGVFSAKHDVGRAVDRPARFEPPLRGETTMPALAVPYAFYAFSVGFSLGPTPAELHTPGSGVVRRHLPVIVAVAVGYGGLALAGLFGAASRRPGAALFLAAWIAIPFALAAWMAVANVKVWNARYVAVSLPAYVMLLGAGLALARAGVRRSLLVLLIGVSLVSLANLRLDPEYAKEDYRSAGAYLDRHLDPDDALIGVGAPAPIFLYAEHRPGSYLLVHPHRIGDDQQLRRRLAAAAAGHARVWLLRVRPYLSDPDNHVGEILGETRVEAVAITFPGVELQRFDGPPPGEGPEEEAMPPPAAAPDAARRPGAAATASGTWTSGTATWYDYCSSGETNPVPALTTTGPPPTWPSPIPEPSTWLPAPVS